MNQIKPKYILWDYEIQSWISNGVLLEQEKQLSPLNFSHEPLKLCLLENTFDTKYILNYIWYKIWYNRDQFGNIYLYEYDIFSYSMRNVSVEILLKC